MNKKIVLVLLSIHAFVDGALGHYLAPGELFPPSAPAMMFIGAVLVFMWYHYDSNEINYRRSTILNVLVVAVAFLALPYYFFRSRGAKNGALYTLYFIGAFVIWAVLQSIGIYVVQSTIQG